LQVQKDVVHNERRQRYESPPWGLELHDSWASLWPEGHPYHAANIGSHAQISAFTVDDVRAFHRAHYQPHNITVALTGDVDAAAARAMVAEHFGGWRASAPHLDRRPPAPAPLPRVVRKERLDGAARLWRVRWAWQSSGRRDAAALDVFATAWGARGYGTLYRALVLDRALALDVVTEHERNQSGGALHVVVTVAPRAAVADVERVLKEEVFRALQRPLPDDDVTRGRETSELAGWARAEQTWETTEDVLTVAADHGDPTTALSARIEAIRAVTVEDAFQAARRVLAKPRVELISRPAAAPEARTDEARRRRAAPIAPRAP
jgi:zinc protease